MALASTAGEFPGADLQLPLSIGQVAGHKVVEVVDLDGSLACLLGTG